MANCFLVKRWVSARSGWTSPVSHTPATSTPSVLNTLPAPFQSGFFTSVRGLDTKPAVLSGHLSPQHLQQQPLPLPQQHQHHLPLWILGMNSQEVSQPWSSASLSASCFSNCWNGVCVLEPDDFGIGGEISSSYRFYELCKIISGLGRFSFI